MALRNVYEVEHILVQERKDELDAMHHSLAGNVTGIAECLSLVLTFQESPVDPVKLFERFLDNLRKERNDELNSFKSFLAERAEFQVVAKHLASNLVFKQVARDHKTPFQALSKKRGQKIAKKLSFFLRHHLPKGNYSENDGSVDVEVIQQKLGFPKEDILLATNLEFDSSSGEKLKKRRFVVLEMVHPCLPKKIRIAALGGHSQKVFAPPGHYRLEKESIKQLAPFTHHTSAAKDIIQAGFLCQQDRKGGINFSTGENVYRPSATHKIEVKAESALEHGFCFFGNRFSNVVFAMGKWEGDCWDGKIPLRFLTITPR